MKVSVCMLTIDRYQMTKRCLENLISKAGVPKEDIQLLILDNGSSDIRIKDYASKIADIVILKDKNIGVSAGFNELFRKATGDYICVVGNDIWLEQNWLKDLINYQGKIKNSGVSSIYCVLEKGKFNQQLGVFIPYHNIVYGVSLWSSNLIKKIGGFDESLQGYGCEDSQFAYRSFMTGHVNYYIPNQNSYHLGEDHNSESEYRKNKNENLEKNIQRLQMSLIKMNQTKNYKIKL